ncbi:MAG TPA: metal-dependent transcriptional regulator [Candidatus Krumholzibacteria bacterium]|nr:metal-dependent transcriptional regulator [Candidatus Krumholzibacteria bacterium]
MHPEFRAQPKDEVLEEIWTRHEAGDDSLSGLLQVSAEEDAPTLVEQMQSEGLLQVEGDRVHLTASGDARARFIVRGHRLAKRLLFDVLNLPADETERTACLMEHVLSPATANAVCALLGHPPRCPEGFEIPAGECCTDRAARQIRPLVFPLPELERGTNGHIVFMTPNSQKRYERLGLFGVVPGSTVRLRQTQPSVVIEIEGTSLALDREVAREIYVRRES